MNKKRKSYKWILALAGLLIFGGLFNLPANAQENPAVSVVDQWIEDVRFQFHPDIVQGESGNTATVQGYFNKTPGFPMWLMMDMGGALLVDKDHFSVNNSQKDQDGIWVLDLSCVDSVNGFFKLNFAIDSNTGEAALKIATPEEGDIAIYQGKIGPYEYAEPDFKNEKRTQEATQTAAILDRLIPTMDFKVKLNSEIYGNKARVIVTPKNVQAWTPRKFDADGFTVICCEKQNGIWYVRLGVGETTEVTEEMVMDLAIDSHTGNVNYRMGFADKLRSNWRAITDGKVELPDNK